MRDRLLRSFPEAALTLLAMLAALACAQALEPGAASAVLAVVLSLSLARSHLAGERRGRLEAWLALPLVSLASVGVGALLHDVPWAGATVFVALMALSIWLRRFGPLALRAGSLVALPLVTLLVAPPLPAHGGGTLARVLAPVGIALAAMACVTLAESIGRRLGWLAPTDPDAAAPDASPATAGALRPSAHTRMALQMAVALAVSFAIGAAWFPSHWRWIVLTAFIVNSGNRGRQDVVHKSALRVAGAAGGTVAAIALGRFAGVDGLLAGAAILSCVFLGTWLRPLGYGWWSLFVTLALALLQGLQPGGTGPVALLCERLVEIGIGAVVGVAAAWFVLPVRSTDVLRRRLADALAAMSEALDPQHVARSSRAVTASLRRVEQLRPSFHARRVALGRWRAPQPADWIDTLVACEAPIVALVERGETPGAVRRAIGAARQSLREPARIGPALAALRDMLSSPPAVS